MNVTDDKNKRNKQTGAIVHKTSKTEKKEKKKTHNRSHNNTPLTLKQITGRIGLLIYPRWLPCVQSVMNYVQS